MARSIPRNRRSPRWLAIADELCRLALVALHREQVIAIAFNPSRGCPAALICKIWTRPNASNRFAVDHEQMRDLPIPPFETNHGNIFATEPQFRATDWLEVAKRLRDFES
jgi:hypothetical protein